MNTPDSQQDPQPPNSEAGVPAQAPAYAQAQPPHTPTSPPVPTPPVSAPSAEHVSQSSSGLSPFLKISIALLALLALASIALVFIGDFAGKGERIGGTFFLFAVFVGLTAADTRIGQRNEWYAPLALIANSYILAVMLIVTWMTPNWYGLGWEIFWYSIVVLVVIRAVVGICQLLMKLGDDGPEAIGRFAFMASVLAVLSGIMFTAPIAIEVFAVRVPELYWKFAVAALLLTALGFAVTLLLRWAYGAQDRERARQIRDLQRSAAAQNLASQQQAALDTAALHSAGLHSAGLHSAGQVNGSAYVAERPQPQPLLPWPKFADGRPLPQGPDGQPDFSAPGAPQPPRRE